MRGGACGSLNVHVAADFERRVDFGGLEWWRDELWMVVFVVGGFGYGGGGLGFWGLRG